MDRNVDAFGMHAPPQVGDGLIAPGEVRFGGEAVNILVRFRIGVAGAVPRWLSLWGFITVFPLLIGTLAAVFGYELPFAIYLPYVPFEFVIGLWILVKGIREEPEKK